MQYVIKISFISLISGFFFPNLGAVSDDRMWKESFIMEKRYADKLKVTMLAEYCWNLVRGIPRYFNKRERQKSHLFIRLGKTLTFYYCLPKNKLSILRNLTYIFKLVSWFVHVFWFRKAVTRWSCLMASYTPQISWETV